MKIRRLEPQDAATLQSFRLRALKEAPTAFVSSYEEEKSLPLSLVEGRLAADHGGGVLGAFVDEALVGVVGLHREQQRNASHKAVMWGVYLAPEYRGQGIAQELVRAALALASSLTGVQRVTLCVNAGNAGAIRLYETFGFEAFGKEPEAIFIDGELHDETYMSLKL